MQSKETRISIIDGLSIIANFRLC